MAASLNSLTRPILELGKYSLHAYGVEFHQKLIGNVIRGHSRQKRVCYAGKTSVLLRGDAAESNRCYVVAHSAPLPHQPSI